MSPHVSCMHQPTHNNRTIFGSRLRQFRESHRIPSSNWIDDTIDGRFLRDDMLCAALSELGCQIDQATYQAIERGDYLPRDATVFLDAFSRVLCLDDIETEDLVTHFVCDLLRHELGDELTRELLAPETREPHHGWT